jgi:PIN domain nuclease of toxin-antitoxin system
MKLLLDTHLLLWAANQFDKLSPIALKLMGDPSNELIFSAASIWEVTIKHSLGRDDFKANPRLLRRGLLENGYQELVITSLHALAVHQLPPIHKDPFDRLLVAQAQSEDIILLTADNLVGKYGDMVKLV